MHTTRTVNFVLPGQEEVRWELIIDTRLESRFSLCRFLGPGERHVVRLTHRLSLKVGSCDDLRRAAPGVEAAFRFGRVL